jgi:predicted nucleic acid-binding protein
MTKPLRDGDVAAVRTLGGLLTRLDLRPVDRAIAELATVLAARYRLRAADATHLATAISVGAKRFITNNRRDFPESIKEIDVTYPEMLPAS